MTENRIKINVKEEIKRYLFAEMNDDEQNAFEEKFILDDELFFEISDAENNLVDLYAKNKLGEADLMRFERSLEKIPARRQKIANAKALQTFIAEERTEEKQIIIVETQTFWQKLANFFTIKTSAYGFAMSAFLVLFALAAGVLFIQNNRQNQELARLENEKQQYEQSSKQREELQNQIANLRERESELQNSIDAERETSGDLTDELQSERRQRKNLERTVETLQREADIKLPGEPASTAPTIASVRLKPGTKTGGRLGTDEQMLDVSTTTKRITVQLSLPDESGADERFSVKLNGKVVAQNLKPRTDSNGQKSLQLIVLPTDVVVGANSLTVINNAGAEIGKYDLETLKKQ